MKQEKKARPVKIRVNAKSKGYLHAVYCLLIANIIIWLIFALPMIKEFHADYTAIEVRAANEEVSVEAGASSPKLPVGSIEWIVEEGTNNTFVTEAQLKCLLFNESNSNNNAISKIRTKENVDLGLFQWSEKYQIIPGNISLGCIGNPACETEKFIEKVNADGNLYAWHGYTNNCLWLE